MAGASFGTRLAAAIRSSGTPLCMGIDPHPGMVPALFGNSTVSYTHLTLPTK